MPEMTRCAVEREPGLAFHFQVEHKSYYQWVPFVLLLQACLFYTPHALFKLAEGGKV